MADSPLSAIRFHCTVKVRAADLVLPMLFTARTNHLYVLPLVSAIVLCLRPVNSIAESTFSPVATSLIATLYVSVQFVACHFSFTCTLVAVALSTGTLSVGFAGFATHEPYFAMLFTNTLPVSQTRFPHATLKAPSTYTSLPLCRDTIENVLRKGNQTLQNGAFDPILGPSVRLH